MAAIGETERRAMALGDRQGHLPRRGRHQRQRLMLCQVQGPVPAAALQQQAVREAIGLDRPCLQVAVQQLQHSVPGRFRGHEVHARAPVRTRTALLREQGEEAGRLATP